MVISNNPQFGIKSVVKSCLLPNLTHLVIKGFELTADKLSLLLQNMRLISCGRLVLEGKQCQYAAAIVDILEDLF